MIIIEYSSSMSTSNLTLFELILYFVKWGIQPVNFTIYQSLLKEVDISATERENSVNSVKAFVGMLLSPRALK